MKTNMRDVKGVEQSKLLVSKQDRMVSIYQKGGPLVATVTVVTDPDGSVSIGLGYTPNQTSVYVEFIDGDDLRISDVGKQQ